jgi:hypothetical protein
MYCLPSCKDEHAHIQFQLLDGALVVKATDLSKIVVSTVCVKRAQWRPQNAAIHSDDAVNDVDCHSTVVVSPVRISRNTATVGHPLDNSTEHT